MSTISRPSSGSSSEGAMKSGSTSVSSAVDADAPVHDKPRPMARLETRTTTQPGLLERLSGLFAENVVAKITRTAVEGLVDNDPPTRYPEYVPQTGPDANRYVLREAAFWTCGFFPGSIYLMLERFVRFPHSIESTATLPAAGRARVQRVLEAVAASWDEPIRGMAGRTDTHDMAFMVMLSQRARFELFHDERARAAVVEAAYALHSRFDARVGAIRSWDALEQDGVAIRSLTDDFLVIIDSMCNLELLYYAAGLTGDATLAAAATAHADTVLASVVRDEGSVEGGEIEGGGVEGGSIKGGGINGEDADGADDAAMETVLYSTFHVANFSPATGALKELRTAQGYARDSTWARGQAWGILGFARTFARTGERRFGRAAAGLAAYFLRRLDDAPACVEVRGCDGPRRGRYVPLWDFDAPVDAHAVADVGPLRDVSAGVIAANGMLVLSQALRGVGATAAADRFLRAALLLVEDALALALARETAEFVWDRAAASEGEEMAEEEVREEVREEAEMAPVRDTQPGRTFAAILKHATANANARDHHRYWDHGLVYADYYLLEFGNNLLRMGLA